jgi:hypothetical protein
MDIRLEIFRALLAPLPPGRLLDLGTGHGKFALLARDLGWEVDAVDVRTERIPGGAGINWIQSDVRDFAIDQPYDCIALLGLFYHLELDDQKRLLRRCSKTLTILDTHVALNATTVVDGYEGRPFQEDLSAPTASWRNEVSFWPTEDALLRLLGEAGYGLVRARSPRYLRDRNFWLCYPA